MDYIEGLPLKKYLEQSLPLDQKFQLFHTILKAIVFAHDTGVIHRDIKPANILVKDSGEPIILDFGLAKCVDFSDKKDETYLTLEGQILGTPGYMSPEQAKGEVEFQDERTDIFSLGIILYEALTGHNPFEGGNVIDICYKIANNPPEPIRTYLPKIPDILESIINKSLENNIKKRYQTAEEFLYDFEEFLAAKKARASAPTPLHKPMAKSTPKDGVICLVCGTENNKESLYCSECNQILKKEFHRNDTKKVKILNQDPMAKARKSMPPLVAEPKSLMNIISQNPQHVIQVRREYPEEEKIIPAFTPVEKPKIVQRPISMFELLIGALGFLFSILPIFYMYRFSLSLHIFDFFIGMFSAYLVFESRKYMAAVFIFPLAFIICCCLKNYFGVIGIPFAPSFLPKLAMGSVVTFFYARCLFYMYKL